MKTKPDPIYVNDEEDHYQRESPMQHARLQASFAVPRLERLRVEIVAVIKAEVADKRLTEAQAFRPALEKALENWFTSSDEGRAAWINTASDFNIGDLANSLPDRELEFYFSREGIFNLTVEIESPPDDWVYDSILRANDNYTASDEDDYFE